MTIKEANKRVDDAKKELEEANANLSLIRSRRKVNCKCEKMHRICDLELIVTHWYVQPHGCTGGDYWNSGEWHFVCPTDGLRNRILFNDYDVKYEDRETINVGAEPTFKSMYRYLFKSSSNEYEDNRPGSFNNYYIDNNRLKFELPIKQKK